MRMDRRAFILGAASVPVAAAIPAMPMLSEEPAFGASFLEAYGKEVVKEYSGEAVFVRTGSAAWKCIKAGYMSPAAVEDMMKTLCIVRPRPGVMSGLVTEYATISPGIHDSIDCTLETSKRVSFPEANMETPSGKASLQG